MTLELLDAPMVEPSNAPPDQIVLALAQRAVEMGASDLFFAAEEQCVSVRVRHLGIVHFLSKLPLDLGRHCIGHIKVNAGMDITEHRRPQDGRWLHLLPGGDRVDLRVNTIPTLYGEDCSLRLLSHGPRALVLEDLGMISQQFNDLLALLNHPSGLVLVTGPTGSGKTTTLYACLKYLNNGERKINTIEDPVEYEIEGIRQSQVNPKIDLTFAELLRGVLRQAPDVIMIGEIRDATTAATAVHAANSGHLVLATVHAAIASAAVQSMRAWGVHPHFLASSLLGVMTQRLVRTLCMECRSPYALTKDLHLFDEIHSWLSSGEGQSLWAATGCPACHRTGYSARTGVFEVLRVNQTQRRLISEGHPTQVLREQAVRDGLMELRQAALIKVAQGYTTAEEVLRAVPSESLGLED